jgi:hypothetical protein
MYLDLITIFKLLIGKVFGVMNIWPEVTIFSFANSGTRVALK